MSLLTRYRVVVLGGGDLATGVVARLRRAGLSVVVVELPRPLAVRRTVAVATAVVEGEFRVEDLTAVRHDHVDDVWSMASTGRIPVVVNAAPHALRPDVVVDARMAKTNLGTTIFDAALVIGLGPGFTAGVDCHVVIETARGANLGRAIHSGSALPNTGVPGEVGGRGSTRVLRAPQAGRVSWTVDIGDVVDEGQPIGDVEGDVITAPFRGIVRGLIAPGTDVPVNLKVGDVDPRLDTDCRLISDKALSVGGGALEAVLQWISAHT